MSYMQVIKQTMKLKNEIIKSQNYPSLSYQQEVSTELVWLTLSVMEG